jgi:hypothetical protein
VHTAGILADLSSDINLLRSPLESRGLFHSPLPPSDGAPSPLPSTGLLDGSLN